MKDTHVLHRTALALSTPLQLALVVAIAAARYRRLPCCLMLQTLVFVAFNKVHPVNTIKSALLALPLQAGNGYHCFRKGSDLCFLTYSGAQVCTAQYFAWYLSLLPLALPSLNVGQHRVRPMWGFGILASSSSQGRLLVASGCWLAAQLHWLAWAYALEFRGREVFLQLWAASILFFGANVALLCVLLRASGDAPSVVPGLNKSTKTL